MALFIATKREATAADWIRCSAFNVAVAL